MISNSIPRLSLQSPIIQNPIGIPANDPSRYIYSNKKLENINCIFQGSDNLGGLFLGDIVSTLKQDLLKSNNIRAILSCMCEKVTINSTVNCHKILPIKDILEYPIIQHFDDAVAWIDQKRKEKFNVLVHCHAGVSRSATIVIAYLIRTQNWNPFQAYEFVRQQRERAKPNASFWNQINEYYNYWSKQNQSEINKPSSICSKENNSNVPHIPQKIASQQILSKRFVSSIHQKPQKQTVQQKTTATEKVNNKQQKTSLTRRRKIFQRLDFEKGIAPKSKKQQIVSQYYINSKPATKQGNPTKLTHNHHTSIIMQDSRFVQNKSSIIPRSNQQNDNIFKQKAQQVYYSPLIYNNNLRPQIKFSSQQIGYNNYMSPDVRSYVHSP